VREVAEHTELRGKTARERGRVVAQVVGESIDLRADVALDELIEHAGTHVPVLIHIMFDSQLADARVKIQSGLTLSISFDRWIRRVRYKDERRVSVGATVREPAGESTLFQRIVAVERFDD